VLGAIVLSGEELGLRHGRALIGVQDCFAASLHVRWTAPAQDQGTVFFAGGSGKP
jgi:hypothetical protein